MILFQLVRTEDATGISGVGAVAQGVEFDDGTVAMRWVAPEGTVKAVSTVIYDSLADVVAIHGHEGRTRVQQVGQRNETSE